jgi:hypothetical protein
LGSNICSNASNPSDANSVQKVYDVSQYTLLCPSQANNGRNAGRYHHIVKQMLKDNSDRYSDFEFKLKEESKRSRSKLGDQLL